MILNRRDFIGSAFSAVIGAAAGFLAGAPAVKASEHDVAVGLDRISAYLNNLTTMQARFTQNNVDGTRSTGFVLLHKPGRARFEYDPPDPALMIMSSGSVAVFDRKSNTGPSIYPSRRTPLHFILSKEVDLSDSRYIIGHYGENGYTEVVLRSLTKRYDGRVTLLFKNEPLELAGWLYTDESGQTTSVILEKVRPGVTIHPQWFSVDGEAKRLGQSR